MWRKIKSENRTSLIFPLFRSISQSAENLTTEIEGFFLLLHLLAAPLLLISLIITDISPFMLFTVYGFIFLTYHGIKQTIKPFAHLKDSQFSELPTLAWLWFCARFSSAICLLLFTGKFWASILGK